MWSNCDSRIISRVAPKWVIHSERILECHEECVIYIDYELDLNGSVTVTDSTAEIVACERFKRSAEISVGKYTFEKGDNETCSMKITYRLKK